MRINRKSKSKRPTVALALKGHNLWSRHRVILKPKAKKLLAPRAAISFKEFKELLNLAAQKENFCSHKRVGAFILMYLTGLRISNLLLLRVGDLEELLEGKAIIINLIKKRGPFPFTISLSKQDIEFCSKYKSSFLELTKGKAYNDFVFSPRCRPHRAYERSTFDKSLNAVCRLACSPLRKNIKTHSLRITYITNALMHNRVEEVQKAVGHSSLSSTLVYDRRVFSKKHRDAFQAKLDSIKFLDDMH